MAKDYYSVLSRAISALDPNTEETRRALYDRARLTIMDAGLPGSETGSERSALEHAIDRLEMEMQQAGARRFPQRPSQTNAQPSVGVDVASAEAQPLRSRRMALLRPIALLASAVLIVAMVAYLIWPRGNGDTPTKPSASAVETVAKRATGGADASPSYIFRRQMVYYRTIHPVGTIVIAKWQHNLYLVRPNTAAVRYTIGIGRECTDAVGLLVISAKEEAPDGPLRLTASGAQVPADAAPRSAAKVGSTRSLALGDTGHRISGTNPPTQDGGDGCFALSHDDMADLYDRIVVGIRVVMN